MLRAKKKVEVYETVDDFVNDVSSRFSPNVKLENIQSIFFYFGGFLIVVLLVFVFDSFLFKKLKKLNRKLLRCTTILVQKMKFEIRPSLYRRVVVKTIKTINLRVRFKNKKQICKETAR